MQLENYRDLDGRRVRLNQRERDELQEELEAVKDEVGTNAGRIESLEHPVVIERPGNQEELWAKAEGRDGE